MTRAVGIDLSLASTGLAALTTQPGGIDIDARTVASKGAEDDTYRQRRDRIFGIVGEISHYATGADLVAVEGPAYSKHTAYTWDRAGLWWAVVDVLMLDGHNVAIVPPNVVKKFASGKGVGDKTVVAVGMAHLWGENCRCANNNEWDALTLATMGGQRLHMPGVPTRAHHEAALASVAWDQPQGAAA